MQGSGHLDEPRRVQWPVQRCSFASQLCKYSESLSQAPSKQPSVGHCNVVLSVLSLSLSPFSAFSALSHPSLSLYKTESQEEEILD